MRNRQIVLIILWLISPLLLFAYEYYIVTSGLNLRSGPGKEYSIVYTLQKGDEVEVLSKHDNWYKIKFLGISGYANSQYLEFKSPTVYDFESYLIGFLVILALIAAFLFDRWIFEKRRELRRDYYRNEYLQSDEWRRKRYVVLKRDNWKCVYCGLPATQVHHTRYAKRNIGKEPIAWLVSICKPCHDSKHPKK